MKDTKFERLYRQYYRLVWARCQRVVGYSPDLDDLVQDVFLLAYQAFDRFEDRGGSFPAWIGTIARNVAINWLRRQWREQPDPTVVDRLDALLAAPTESQVEIQQLVQAVLVKLSQPQRQVLYLLVQGFGPTEIADILEILPKTAGTRIFRARQRVLEVLPFKP